jgi:superfamily II DNA/RNA helicase
MPEGASFASLAPQVAHCHLIEVKRHHVDALRRIVHALDAKHVLVFMNHQDRLKDAMHKLASKGMPVAALHGEMGKQKRHSVLQQFRSGAARVLLVSDVVARGLDVESCDAVVNLEMPSNPAHYAHRAGRTGRMGRPGVVCSIVEQQHVFVVDKMRTALQVDIPQCRSTGGRATIIRDGKVVVLGRFYDVPKVEKASSEAVPEERDVWGGSEDAVGEAVVS